MVYASSVPSYLDPPPNWNQQQQQEQQQQQQQHHHQQQLHQQQQLHHQQQLQHQHQQQQAHHHHQAGPGINPSIAAAGYGAGETHLHHQSLNQPLPPLPDATNTGGGTMVAAGGSSAARPGSMADRARQAKLPIPEQALRCPRCDSTNTKFCYFNNYSLTQPRHFCKTCRRYWTRGGALRNVPVGGGCRRNKRSKGSSGASSSKSSAAGASAASGGLLAAAAAAAGGAGGPGAMGGSLSGGIQLQSHHMPFLGSLQSLDYGAGASINIGLNYGGMEPVLDYQQVASSNGSGMSSLEHWRQQLQHAQQHQQFHLFGGVLEPAETVPSTLGLLSPFNTNQGVGDPGAPAALILNSSGRIHSKASAASASAGLITQLASVKMEENARQQGLGNLARQYLGININPAAPNAASGSTASEQYWLGGGDDGRSTGGGNGGGNVANSAWTNLSGFNSSSTGHL